MDLALERLVIDPACRTAGGAIRDDDLAGLRAGPGMSDACVPDHAAFKKLVNQLGLAFAPTALGPARTGGVSGFHLTLEATYTDIDQSKDYWRRGTEGRVDPTTRRAPELNADPEGGLSLYGVKLTKGFGVGLELAASLGFMTETSLVSGGADLRFALLEGFRSGFVGVLPDMAVGGGVRTLTGTPQLQLTVASADAVASKGFTLFDTSVLTPWVGLQQVWIFGDSGLLDLTPATDALEYCNYAGQNSPGSRDPGKTELDGQPVCLGGSPLDFKNNALFNRARLERRRLLFGLSYRYEQLALGAQFTTDLGAPAEAQTSKADEAVLAGEKRQSVFQAQLGAAF
jgi:hypothetical protein